MIPLRDVLDQLDVEITWNNNSKAAEFHKGALWTSVQVDKDQYIFGRMYKSLGTAPALKDGKMYVPASFFSAILSGSVSTEKEGVSINFEQQRETITTTGVITGISNNDKYSSVKINGLNMNGLVLNVSEETLYQAADGSTLTLNDLKMGQSVEVEHALIATLSLPPQTPTYRITVKDKDYKAEWLGTEGTIQEVNDADSNSPTSIRVQGSGIGASSPDEVVLNVSEDTTLIHVDGTKATVDELTKDAKVVAFYSPLLTRSLPPIGNAEKVIVVPAE
ncbi:Protease inhibitor precursor [compost metagenome]